jgi:thioredoxin 1
MAPQRIQEVSSDTFEQDVLRSSLPVLVEFGAAWCPPCKMLAPIVEAVAQDYAGKLHVVTVDVDVNVNLQMQYQVMGLPTLILFRNGQPIQRIVGFKTREKLESCLRPLLQNA